MMMMKLEMERVYTRRYGVETFTHIVSGADDWIAAMTFSPTTNAPTL